MSIDKTKAVLDEEGSIKTFTIKINGKSFRCSCSSNCFHKPFKDTPDVYRCNSCNTTYSGHDK